MDKQKQIEEMAKDINNTWFVKPNGDICGTNEKLKKNDIQMISQQLICAGYRKIPENAVVLTREEWAKRNAEIEIIKIDNDTYLKEAKRVCELELKARRELEKLKRDFDYNLVQERKQIRKEMAEKFAERVKMAFYYEFDELIPSIMADKIDEIAKEITGG